MSTQLPSYKGGGGGRGEGRGEGEEAKEEKEEEEKECRERRREKINGLSAVQYFRALEMCPTVPVT